jgi:hypothetical protein
VLRDPEAAVRDSEATEIAEMDSDWTEAANKVLRDPEAAVRDSEATELAEMDSDWTEAANKVLRDPEATVRDSDWTEAAVTVLNTDRSALTEPPVRESTVIPPLMRVLNKALSTVIEVARTDDILALLNDGVSASPVVVTIRFVSY